MDRDHIDAAHVIDRYVQGRLPADERDEFEIYLLEHPEVADEVAFARAMQASLLAHRDELFDECIEPATVPAAATGSFWRNYAAAATVLFALTSGFSAYLYTQTAATTSEPGITGAQSAEPFRLEAIRGDAIPTLERRDGDTVRIEADVDIDGSDRYLVEIASTDGTFVLRHGGLTASGGLVSITVGDLPDGDYLCGVYGEPGMTQTAEYRFAVTTVTN